MKRFLALVAISTLLFTAGACSKDKAGDDTQATPSVTGNAGGTLSPEDLEGSDVGFIALGGYFTGENTNLSVFISDSSLYVNAIHFSDNGAAPLILTGPLTYTEGTTDLVYEEGNDKLTFTFATDSVTVTVNKGSTYADFAGKFARTTDTVAETGSVVPKSGSALESVGRIALTLYLANAEGSASYSYDAAAAASDNAAMLKFISLYADLFLTGAAEPVPEVSDKYLCYGFAADDLNNLLLAATAGKFSVKELSVADSDIVLKDDTYYVPCPGTYAGGIASNYTEDNPEVIAENLLLEGSVVKTDGTRYDLEMILSTSSNKAAGTAGVQIDSATYKIVK